MPSALGLVYCAEGGHWIFEWNVHSLSYFIEYGQISKWEKHWGLWTNQRKTETNCNILHIYESWHVHDSSHIWVIKTLPRHFKKNTIIKEVPPALLRASGLRWKNQAWRSLWGRWRREARWRRWRREAHLNQFSERRGSNFFGFCNSHAARCLAIWCSDEKSYTGGWQMDGMWWKSFKVKI